MAKADSVLSTPPINTSAIEDPQPSPMPERFERNPQTFVGCMGLVYVGVADRKTFDAIGAPCQDASENENGHVLVKQIGNHGENEVTVIFQYWIKSRTLEAMFADILTSGKGYCHEHEYQRRSETGTGKSAIGDSQRPLAE
jgi:hypothetical protein